MKTANSFYWTFIDTLVYNIATIAAVVVGITQFAIRAFNENNGAQKVRKVTQTVLQFVDTSVDKLQVLVNTDVPEVKVARKSPKRK
jgi:hypothetical protein